MSVLEASFSPTPDGGIDRLESIAAQHMFMWARGQFDETALDTLDQADRAEVEALIESANITIEWDDIDS